jgi:hypothetical protein
MSKTEVPNGMSAKFSPTSPQVGMQSVKFEPGILLEPGVYSFTVVGDEVEIWNAAGEKLGSGKIKNHAQFSLTLPGIRASEV